jgi:uncharacterized membrane protein
VRSFRPVHALLLVACVLGGGLALERALGRSGRFERVRPDAAGRVAIDFASIPVNDVRFFRFLNAGNQEVRFLVGKDAAGGAQVAFDASENDYKMKRGFRAQAGWVISNKCDSSFRLAEINAQPSGCAPVPLRFRREGDRVVLAESDLLAGWRYFR